MLDGAPVFGGREIFLFFGEEGKRGTSFGGKEEGFRWVHFAGLRLARRWGLKGRRILPELSEMK